MTTETKGFFDGIDIAGYYSHARITREACFRKSDIKRRLLGRIKEAEDKLYERLLLKTDDEYDVLHETLLEAFGVKKE